jgi:hypothetical protein
LRVSAGEQPSETEHRSHSNRKVIHATCALHRGPVGFANVVLTKRGDEVELDPHVTGCCVITFEEDAATAVRDTITEWLG